MPSAVFHLDVGDFACTVISDGILHPDESAASRSNEQTGAEVRDVDYVNCLLINTGKQKILVDTGCGPGFQSTAGKLVQNLQTEGIEAGDINRVIFTHGHLDHVCGSFDSEGRLVFPNARFTVSKIEWEWWVTEPQANDLQNDLFNTARNRLVPMSERFDIFEKETDIVPGIKLISAPGHTPGNVMVDLSSVTDQLLCVGDIIHSQKEFIQPDCYSQFDVDADMAEKTRSSVLSRVASAGILLFIYHFPFPGLGHIVKRNHVFDWVPLSKTSK